LHRVHNVGATQRAHPTMPAPTMTMSAGRPSSFLHSARFGAHTSKIECPFIRVMPCHVASRCARSRLSKP
jgi:hypothetical protein